MTQVNLKKQTLLTQNLVHRLFNYDTTTGILTNKLAKKGITVGAEAGTVDKTTGYKKVTINQYSYRVHRVIWLFVTGSHPSESIDHLNNCRSDNRFENLRSISQFDNMQHRLDNTSGTSGVYYQKSRGKWIARIHANGKTVHLGSFSTKELAIEARLAAEKSRSTQAA